MAKKKKLNDSALENVNGGRLNELAQKTDMMAQKTDLLEQKTDMLDQKVDVLMKKTDLLDKKLTVTDKGIFQIPFIKKYFGKKDSRFI